MFEFAFEADGVHAHVKDVLGLSIDFGGIPAEEDVRSVASAQDLKRSAVEGEERIAVRVHLRGNVSDAEGSR